MLRRKLLGTILNNDRFKSFILLSSGRTTFFPHYLEFYTTIALLSLNEPETLKFKLPFPFCSYLVVPKAIRDTEPSGALLRNALTVG